MIFYLPEGAEHFMLHMVCPMCGEKAVRVSMTDRMANYICMDCKARYVMKRMTE